jgi:hypothetical protein
VCECVCECENTQICVTFHQQPTTDRVCRLIFISFFLLFFSNIKNQSIHPYTRVYTKNNTNMSSQDDLTTDQLHTLTVLNATFSAFSFAGSAFIVFMYVCAKDLRSFAFKLVRIGYIGGLPYSACMNVC